LIREALLLRMIDMPWPCYRSYYCTRSWAFGVFTQPRPKADICDAPNSARPGPPSNNKLSCPLCFDDEQSWSGKLAALSNHFPNCSQGNTINVLLVIDTNRAQSFSGKQSKFCHKAKIWGDQA